MVVEILPPLAVYELENNYYVTSNICTHGMAFMTEGEQDSDEIECPFHGGAFNFVTVEVISMPCHIPLETFPVIINDDYVCIEKPIIQ